MCSIIFIFYHLEHSFVCWGYFFQLFHFLLLIGFHLRLKKVSRHIFLYWYLQCIFVLYIQEHNPDTLQCHSDPPDSFEDTVWNNFLRIFRRTSLTIKQHILYKFEVCPIMIMIFVIYRTFVLYADGFVLNLDLKVFVLKELFAAPASSISTRTELEVYCRWP